MANKNFDFYVRFVDPDEAAANTPAKRRERTTGPYAATTVQRALSKFYAEHADLPDSEPHSTHEQLWLKGRIVVLDVMRARGQAGPQMSAED